MGSQPTVGPAVIDVEGVPTKVEVVSVGAHSLVYRLGGVEYAAALGSAGLNWRPVGQHEIAQEDVAGREKGS